MHVVLLLCMEVWLWDVFNGLFCLWWDVSAHECDFAIIAYAWLAFLTVKQQVWASTRRDIFLDVGKSATCECIWCKGSMNAAPAFVFLLFVQSLVLAVDLSVCANNNSFVAKEKHSPVHPSGQCTSSAHWVVRPRCIHGLTCVCARQCVVGDSKKHPSWEADGHGRW